MVERRILLSFSLLKDISALATVTGVVRRILGAPLLAGPPPIGGYGGRLLRRWVRALEFKFLTLLLTIKPVKSTLFCLETDFVPAFQLIMYSHKDVSLMQFQVNACLFYKI